MEKRLKRFLGSFLGSSVPTLCETEDGEVWVLKMHGAGNGPESLLSEYIVNALAASAGLPVPEPTMITIPDDTPWRYGTDEFHDIVKKSGGQNLGLQYLGETKPVPESDYNGLSTALVSQIVTLDLTFANVDRRRSSQNLLQDRRGAIWIVDHGSCRFLRRAERAAKLPTDHSFAGWEDLYDPKLLDVRPQRVQAIVKRIPAAWLSSIALSREQISHALLA
jgi:hypothetical protein